MKPPGRPQVPPAAVQPPTVSEPCIAGWIRHTNGYVPAVGYVTVTDPPPAIVPLSHEPSANVTVCGTPSPLVHVIAPPAATVMPVGNVKPLMVAASPVASGVTSQADAAADAGASDAGASDAAVDSAGAGVGCSAAGVASGVAGAGVAAPPPQAATTRASTLTRMAARGRRMEDPPSGPGRAGSLADRYGTDPPPVSPGGSPVVPAAPRDYSGEVTRTLALDDATIRALERHETEAHAIPAREMRDLGDALVLFDPRDPDPFWNRMVSVRWPAGAAAFDRRLGEALALFAILGRTPHVWPSPVHSSPPDLVARLSGHGFRDIGGGHVMVLPEPSAIRPVLPAELDRGVTLTAIRRAADAGPDDAVDAAAVLVAGFGAEPGRVDDLAGDLRATLDDPRITLVLVRVAGEAVAVAKATSMDGFTYLSSIATRPGYRGRGLASIATRHAIVAGGGRASRLAYLGVWTGNAPAIRLYERLGFATLGEAPDLLFG